MNIPQDNESFDAVETVPPPLPVVVKKKRVPPIIWILLGVSVLLNLAGFAGRGGFSDYEYPTQEYPEVDATLAWGNSGADADVAILKLEGVILDQPTSTLFGGEMSPVQKLLLEIRAVTADFSYQAILLEVDSPGGGVTASDEIYQALVAFKESDPDRRIIAHVKDMAASGGYYAALAADEIVAQPTSLVGSIGVMISAVNFHKLGEKIGVQDVTLASSDNKALLNGLAPVNPEHEAILQDVVDDMYDRFRGLVLENRPFEEAFAEEHNLLDGRVFTLPDARDFGLVDQVGYGDTARKAVVEALGVSDAAFYEVSVAAESLSWLFAEAPRVTLPRLPQSRFMYLWTP